MNRVAKRLMENEEWRARRLKWLEDPMTQDHLRILEADAEVNIADPSTLRAEGILYQHGVKGGQQSNLRLLKFLELIALEESKQRDVQATYGAEETVKEPRRY